jgi:hypothetical protein
VTCGRQSERACSKAKAATPISAPTTTTSAAASSVRVALSSDGPVRSSSDASILVTFLVDLRGVRPERQPGDLSGVPAT